MEYKAEKKIMNESFYFEGVSMLDVSVFYVEISDEDKTSKKLNEFYKSIAEGAYAFAKEKLLSDSRKEYEGSTDEKKRFSFRPYRYSLDISLYAQDENSLFFSLDVVLMRKGKRMYSEKFLHVWDKKSALLRKDRKKKSKKEAQK